MWNYNKSELTHKPEEAFSDHIKAYLDLTMRASGMVINREVQLNRGRNGEAGSRTDIWITALSKDQLSNISLCIEVKGSWNPSAPTAMEEQLVEKYMGAGGADAGIFLIGWFDSKKYPQSNMWHNNRESAIADLTEQSQLLQKTGLLLGGIVIDCDYRL